MARRIRVRSSGLRRTESAAAKEGLLVVMLEGASFDAIFEID